MSQNNNEKNYLSQACLLLLTILIVLLTLPFFITEETSLKRIDLLSDIRPELKVVEESIYNEVALKPTTTAEPIDSLEQAPKRDEDSLRQQKEDYQQFVDSLQQANQTETIRIYDFSPDSTGLKTFIAKLDTSYTQHNTLRIAVLGDSFIEGDILCDALRNQLQAKYGGQGIGLIGMTSIVAGFRRSISHNFGSWETEFCLNKGQEAQTMYGYRYHARAGAFAQYRAQKNKNCHAKATLYYSTTNDVDLEIRTDSTSTNIRLENSNGLLQSKVIYSGQAQKKLSLNVIGNATALTVFGLGLDDHNGVSLDNISIRGSAGYQITSLDPVQTKAMAELRPYDLIVVEYGLNVVSAKQTNYESYRKTMGKCIQNLKSYYPNTPLLILGVSDRYNASGSLHKNSVSMNKSQLGMAQDNGTAFWSVLEAVMQMGGVKELTMKGWADRAYTHLSHKGGEKVAEKLFEAIELERKYYEHQQD